jgi:hypothetical protein
VNDGHSNGSFDSRRASLIVALLSGAITLRNGSKTYENSLGIQDLKGAVDRDLERLRAKLSHGQIVSSTQWNAEFSSYQAIWKGMASARFSAECEPGLGTAQAITATGHKLARVVYHVLHSKELYTETVFHRCDEQEQQRAPPQARRTTRIPTPTHLNKLSNLIN